MEVFLGLIILIFILALVIISFIKIKYKSFFLLWILSFIWVLIFSSTIVFLLNSNSLILGNYSLTLSDRKIEEVVLKDSKITYFSWLLLSGSLYELRWKNFLIQNTYSTWIDLTSYVTKADMKDYYMDAYNKRIEWMQNQINVFLTIITIIWTLLLFLWYRSTNVLEEKTNEKLDKYFDKDSQWKTILDGKIVEYIESNWWKDEINNQVKQYIESNPWREEINKPIKEYMESPEGRGILNDAFSWEVAKYVITNIKNEDFNTMLKDAVDREVSEKVSSYIEEWVPNLITTKLMSDNVDKEGVN